MTRIRLLTAIATVGLSLVACCSASAKMISRKIQIEDKTYIIPIPPAFTYDATYKRPSAADPSKSTIITDFYLTRRPYIQISFVESEASYDLVEANLEKRKSELVKTWRAQSPTYRHVAQAEIDQGGSLYYFYVGKSQCPDSCSILITMNVPGSVYKLEKDLIDLMDRAFISYIERGNYVSNSD